jgi:hypothetical protein
VSGLPRSEGECRPFFQRKRRIQHSLYLDDEVQLQLNDYVEAMHGMNEDK